MNITRRLCTTTERTEFHIPLRRVLSLIAPEDAAEGDVWCFVQGPEGLILCRDRQKTEVFDDKGERQKTDEKGARLEAQP